MHIEVKCRSLDRCLQKKMFLAASYNTTLLQKEPQLASFLPTILCFLLVPSGLLHCSHQFFSASLFPAGYTKIEKQNQNNSILIFLSSYGALRGKF